MKSVARVRACGPSPTRHSRKNKVGLVIGAVGVLDHLHPILDRFRSLLRHERRRPAILGGRSLRASEPAAVTDVSKRRGWRATAASVRGLDAVIAALQVVLGAR